MGHSVCTVQRSGFQSRVYTMYTQPLVTFTNNFHLQIINIHDATYETSA